MTLPYQGDKGPTIIVTTLQTTVKLQKHPPDRKERPTKIITQKQKPQDVKVT